MTLEEEMVRREVRETLRDMTTLGFLEEKVDPASGESMYRLSEKGERTSVEEQERRLAEFRTHGGRR